MTWRPMTPHEWASPFGEFLIQKMAQHHQPATVRVHISGPRSRPLASSKAGPRDQVINIPVGVLSQLSEIQRWIAGHELAHLVQAEAPRSAHAMAALGVSGLGVVVILAPLAPAPIPVLSFLLVVAILVLLWSQYARHQRPKEIAADRWAAEQGAPITDAVVERLVRCEGFRPAWFEPFCTHPRPHERMALQARADRPLFSPPALRRQKGAEGVGSRVAVGHRAATRSALDAATAAPTLAARGGGLPGCRGPAPTVNSPVRQPTPGGRCWLSHGYANLLPSTHGAAPHRSGWPPPRNTRHVWILGTGIHTPPVQGFVVAWHRHSYRWSCLCCWVETIDGADQLIQRWLPAERLRPVRTDPNRIIENWRFGEITRPKREAH